MTPLRQRMLEDMRLRNLSQEAYVDQVARFARHFGQSPERLGPEQIRAYQLYLTDERRLAPKSIIVAIAALRFLYHVTLGREWDPAQVLPIPNGPRRSPS